MLCPMAQRLFNSWVWAVSTCFQYSSTKAPSSQAWLCFPVGQKSQLTPLGKTWNKTQIGV